MFAGIFESESFLVFFVLAIVWIFGFFTIRKLNVGKDKKFELSIRNLAAMSVFLVTYNIYLNVRSNNRIEKNRMAYNTLENVENHWLAPQRELLENYPEGYFLYASMMQEADLTKNQPTSFDTLKRKQLEIYSSIRVFQAMEDFLSTGSYDLSGNYVWINCFLLWMQSPILCDNWQKYYFTYGADTRDFVDRIILESAKLSELRINKGKLSGADYDVISKKFPVKLR